MSSKQIAVVGAGITGLTAAFRLKQAGHAVTVFDASNRPGGVIQTVQQDGWLAECGPNTMLETSPLITKLVEDPDLNIADRRRDASPLGGKRYVLKKGKPVKLPGSPGEFLSSSLFSFKAKMRLLKEPFIGRHSSDAEEESLADFVRRRLGEEFVDYGVNPFVAGIYAGDPEKLSVKQAFPRLHALEMEYGSLIRGQIFGAKKRRERGNVSKAHATQFSFDQGLQVLTDALGIYVYAGEGMQLGVAIQSVSMGQYGQWTIGTNDGELPVSYDEVILALPAYQLAQLNIKTQWGKGSQLLAPLAEIHYPPVSSVVLGFRKEDVKHPLDGFGTLNPEVEKVNTLGTLFTSTLFPDRAPEGHVLLTTYIGGTRAPDLALKKDAEKQELVMEDLRKIYGVSGEPAFVYISTHERAIPQYEVGYGQHQRFIQGFTKDNKGLHIAGHCKDGISVGDCVLAGEKVADKIMDVG